MKIEVKDRSKLCLGISAAICVIAIVLSVLGMGMDLGIDFTGGIIMTYDMGGAFETADIEAALAQQGITESRIAHADGNQAQIRIKDVDNSDEMRIALEETLKETYPDIAFVTVERVGAVVGRDLVSNAIKSIVIASILMLVYIAFRFDLFSGIAAVLALLHDVAIMIAFMVIFSAIVQVNSTFIAALLTIVGYSINNTIIIFDRIRENEKKLGKSVGYSEIVSRSVSECMGRTIGTTLTTLFTVVSLYVLGVESIREFSLPLIVGIIAGTYSSIGISGYLWAMMMNKRDAAKKAKAAK